MRDPSFQPFRNTFETLHKAIGRSEKNPVTGLTQGGSSDKNAGCKSAAFNPDIYRHVPNKEEDNGSL